MGIDPSETKNPAQGGVGCVENTGFEPVTFPHRFGAGTEFC